MLDQVLELGELHVVTRDTPTSYFIGPEGPAGPEYDLVKGFAEYLGVELVIDTVDITPDLAAHRILIKLEAMGFIR